MSAIKNQVALSLILLWSHEKGELCNKIIPQASSQPELTIVNANGQAIDTSVENYDGSDAYGVHLKNGTVYWANAIFNAEYIVWPESIDQDKKALIIAQLEKSFLIIK